MKIIIKSDFEFDIDNLPYVQAVMSKGLISKKGNQNLYCWVTTFKNGVVVCCDITKNGTHIFNITHNKTDA